MRRLYLEGEIGAALDLAASVHPPAPALLRDAVPFVRDDAPNADELVTDPRAAFVLAQVDGVSDVSKLVTELPMPDDEAFGVLAALVEVGVLGTRTSSVG